MGNFASKKSEFGQSCWCFRKNFPLVSLCFVQSWCIMNECSARCAERVCRMKKADFLCILQNQSNITLLAQAVTFPKPLVANMYSKQTLKHHFSFVTLAICYDCKMRAHQKPLKKLIAVEDIRRSRFRVAFCFLHWMLWENLLKMQQKLVPVYVGGQKVQAPATCSVRCLSAYGRWKWDCGIGMLVAHAAFSWNL